jgi:hypothetical protein
MLVIVKDSKLSGQDSSEAREKLLLDQLLTTKADVLTLCIVVCVMIMLNVYRVPVV